jgi:hypothetical protein
MINLKGQKWTDTMTARYSHFAPESQKQAFEAVANIQRQAHKAEVIDLSGEVRK